MRAVEDIMSDKLVLVYSLHFNNKLHEFTPATVVALTHELMDTLLTQCAGCTSAWSSSSWVWEATKSV